MSIVVLSCENCNEPFEREYRHFNQKMRKSRRLFCSTECHNAKKSLEYQIIQMCLCCGEPFENSINKVDRHKFCSQSCSASFNNKNKTKGVRRSKIELFIEKQLISIFPDIEIVFNDKNAIDSELDIYFPTLHLAFELNGIFHYEPIFGETKLEKIQTNDKTKMISCIKRGIDLCVIDISQIKRFTEQSSIHIVKTIMDIVNDRRDSNSQYRI